LHRAGIHNIMRTLSWIHLTSDIFQKYFQLSIIQYLLFTVLLVGLEFELRALHLQSKHSTTWVTSPVHLFWRWGLANYLPGLVSNLDQVAVITGVSHWHLASSFFINCKSTLWQKEIKCLVHGSYSSRELIYL
jgi:hypothetical protein